MEKTLSEVEKNKIKLKKGYILYEGQSMINNDNIVAILTLNSKNIKTGNMSQLWILHSDINPIKASEEKKDIAICGNCQLRRSLNGACYVNLGQAPLSIFRTYKRNGYDKLDIEEFDKLSGLTIRFGAYGDVGSLPIEIVNKLKSVSRNHTSYTHQWRENIDNEILKKVSMASVDNIEEAIEASNNGWRYFRVSNNNDILDNEIICPNVTKGINCIDCKLCSGNTIKAKNIVIPVHGSWKNRFK